MICFRIIPKLHTHCRVHENIVCLPQNLHDELHIIMALTITLDSFTIFLWNAWNIFMTNLLRPHLHLVYCRFIFINKSKIFLMMHMCDLYHTSPTNMSWFVPHKCNCKTKCKQTLSHIYKITTGNKIQITRFCIIINMNAISLSGAFLISIFVGHLQSSLSDNHSHHVRSI